MGNDSVGSIVQTRSNETPLFPVLSGLTKKKSYYTLLL
ncbi:hypothetical protein B4113_0743 [Geobacillus sp. B4113_201601]|nr:hypothetical protein B4113_0743 [Geobacillus sp. B4113_201601]